MPVCILPQAELHKSHQEQDALLAQRACIAAANMAVQQYADAQIAAFVERQRLCRVRAERLRSELHGHFTANGGVGSPRRSTLHSMRAAGAIAKATTPDELSNITGISAGKPGSN